jgi:hypothetical protein
MLLRIQNSDTAMPHASNNHISKMPVSVDELQVYVAYRKMFTGQDVEEGEDDRIRELIAAHKTKYSLYLRKKLGAPKVFSVLQSLVSKGVFSSQSSAAAPTGCVEPSTPLTPTPLTPTPQPSQSSTCTDDGLSPDGLTPSVEDLEPRRQERRTALTGMAHSHLLADHI